jgi:alkylated DNA repair dioxygenase AlkB
MSWHADDEKDVGSTIVSLSLGSPTIMRFKAKNKESSTSNDPSVKITVPNKIAPPPLIAQRLSDVERHTNMMFALNLNHGDIVVMVSLPLLNMCRIKS